MKDVFKEKYLKYDPSITLEIFTLVWNRLIKLGYKSFNNYTVEERYDEFKGLYSYFRTTQEHPNEFSCYSNTDSYTETTVEEILGYNPFIKETKPSKDWSKATEEELLEEAERRYPIGCKVKLIGQNTGGNFGNEVRFTSYSFSTYEERKLLFIDYNLLIFDNATWAEIESLPEVKVKDETKEVIPEYIECIKPQSCYFIPGIVYKVLNTECKSSCKIISNIKCSHYEANSSLYVSLNDTSYFKPSTKEAFDAQIEKEPTRLSFYVKYCDEFTEDLLKSLMKWSQKNTTLKDRGRDNSFEGLKNDGYFLFDNFGLTAPKTRLYKDRTGYGYGVDNNAQDCFKEYSIKEVKELIGYKEQKPIEKWTVGGYVVAINNGNANGKPKDKYQIGFINKITHSFSDGTCGLEFSSNCCNKSDFRCFATKSEAEEFAKTLVEPDKEEVKQAVHCTTQEEWDFVLSKFNPRKLSSTSFTMYSDSLIITTDESNKFNIGCYGSVRLQQSEYQILSFQEWCKLNNYSMANKKYTIKELETNRKLVIYIDSSKEHDKIQKYSKRICPYYGNYCYSLYEKTYSSSSSKSCSGAYKDSIILTIDDIIFKDEEISDESYIGKYVSFNYNERFYDKAFIIRENSYIYLLNNCHSNNNGHINKLIYKYSLRFDSIEEMLLDLKNIKFLDFKDIGFKPLTEDDLIWEIVEAPDKIKLNYLPEPN